MPAIDFGQVEDIKPVPAGTYPATIVKAEEGVSNNDNPKIDLQWKIESGEKGTDGRIIFDTMTFTEKTMPFVKQQLLGLGFDKNFSGNVTAEMLLGKSAQITIDIQVSDKTDPNTGEVYAPRNRVKRIKQIGRKRG